MEDCWVSEGVALRVLSSVYGIDLFESVLVWKLVNSTRENERKNEVKGSKSYSFLANEFSHSRMKTTCYGIWNCLHKVIEPWSVF